MTSASVDFKMRNATFLLFDRWMLPPFAKGTATLFFFVGRQVVSGHAGHWLETTHLRQGWEDFAGKNWKDYGTYPFGGIRLSDYPFFWRRSLKIYHQVLISLMWKSSLPQICRRASWRQRGLMVPWNIPWRATSL